jgi:hypothetical protein
MPTRIFGAIARDGLKTSSLGDCAKKCQQAFLAPLPRRAYIQKENLA